ncbi:glycoside hydrolase family 3 protein [Alkalihalobacillus sp. AL-G]|uniref:glycoside hydrolase family 3 protein n=1 Tax=Alkalihalobacillus sp. AL-G TaxID=2926399 RepID=UPI00272BDD16|nr:glycoside hydrolase family 3 protein [Alkalihalobacillus sp. AL-G]WLD92812.1 glycoside hydrolase family 3 protein [Alkalihalobacillus sp. AL-G]
MNRFNKSVLLSLLAAVILLGQIWFLQPSRSAKAAGSGDIQDLIILQNVSDVKAEGKDGQIQLNALHVYTAGHFMTTSKNLAWISTNKNVASVDEDGTVELTGQNGRTFIKVTDGVYEDRIGIHYKASGKEGPGKPDVYPVIIKQKGDRYNIIQQAISKMTVEEKVGQMLMPDLRTWDGEDVTEMLPEIEQLVDEYHLGGVILFRENVVTTEQTARLVSQYQKAAGQFGMLMTIDQEGGIVTRLQSGTDMPGNMALGATRSTELAENVGRVIGEELDALGINMNLAPVLDVNNNPDNPVIGVRSFGEDPQLVANMGVAYIKGLQSTGASATAKHFPGHGDTSVDSHLGLPEVPHDKERLLAVELYPFQKAMEAGIDAIMTAHVTFPKIDDTKIISKKDGTEVSLPATLSHKVLTGLVREEMGFDGVIITDALNMGAIVDHFGTVDAAIRAVKAGTDIVLMPVGLEEVAGGLVNAVETGEITKERINSAVDRILTLKVKRGIIKTETQQPIKEKIAKALKVVGSKEHKQVEKEAADQSITLVKNEGVLPLGGEPEESIVIVGRSYITSLGDAVKARHENTMVIRTPSSYELSETEMEQVRNADKVIVGTYSYSVSTRLPDHPQMEMVQRIMEETEAPVIGVGIRNPYDIMAYPEVDAYIAQYGFRSASFDATAATMFGANSPVGKLPVTIPGYDGNVLYQYGHGLTY